MGNSASFELEKNSPIPLYFQLKEDMIKKINNEEYKVNESLPSETQLMTMYGVSRTTVRQAIDLLVNEGYLEKRRSRHFCGQAEPESMGFGRIAKL